MIKINQISLPFIETELFKLIEIKSKVFRNKKMKHIGLVSKHGIYIINVDIENDLNLKLMKKFIHS